MQQINLNLHFDNYEEYIKNFGSIDLHILYPLHIYYIFLT